MTSPPDGFTHGENISTATDWCVPRLLPRGLVMFCGTPESMKTWAALHTAVAIYSGEPILNSWSGGPPAEVLVLAPDQSVQETKIRLSALMAGKSSPLGPCPPFAMERPTLDVEQGRERLMQAIAATGAKLVIIDCLNRVVSKGTDLSKGASATPFINGLRDVADATGCTFLLLHHVRKSSTEGRLTMKDVLGSIDIVASLDALYLFDRHEAERIGAEEVTHVTCGKMRGGRRPPAFLMALRVIEDDKGQLTSATLRHAGFEKNEDDYDDEAILALVAEYNNDGYPFTVANLVEDSHGLMTQRAAGDKLRALARRGRLLRSAAKANLGLFYLPSNAQPSKPPKSPKGKGKGAPQAGSAEAKPKFSLPGGVGKATPASTEGEVSAPEEETTPAKEPKKAKKRKKGASETSDNA